MRLQTISYIIIAIFITAIIYTLLADSKNKDNSGRNNKDILPYGNIFCKDKTIKDFARDKTCQSLIEDYCACFYNKDCNIAYDVKNKLVNLVKIDDKYYLHIIQEKDKRLVNVVFELGKDLYIKSIKCVN